MNETELNHKCCNATDTHEDAGEKHPSHKQLLNRFRRTEGQIRGVINMIESERYCVDILVQTRAIIAALRFAEAEILNKHISSCVRDAMNSKDAGAVDVKLQEIMNLMQKIG